MFARFVLPSFTALFTVAAFSVALSIFCAVAWRALRMRRSDAERFSRLPFDTETPTHADKPSSAP